ncbi:MAG: aldehyde dehydrogenase family protein [Candidatus Aminicenantes bacterium]|nr:aldehyde dehydrogenase family protein [Candidatus Aminicenantes bacterium]
MKHDLIEPILIGGKWQKAESSDVFQAWNPANGEKIDRLFPVSSWPDIEKALSEAEKVIRPLAQSSAEKRADFFFVLADWLEKRREEIVAQAHLETALPVEPRLNSVEFPRLVNQIRQAAEALKEGSWCQATIDTKLNIRAKYGPLGGSVIIFSPNNFPLVFNSVCGGDFISALAVGNPVIAKANPSHPGTTKLLSEIALEALKQVNLPPASFQMIYHFNSEICFQLITHPTVAAIAFTGSRQSGLKIKEVAEKAGKLVYCELSSVNPVFFLPGILKEKATSLATELFASCTLGEGQFCTKPGLIVFQNDEAGQQFLNQLKKIFHTVTGGYLVSPQVLEKLKTEVERFKNEEAELLVGGELIPGPGFRFAPTLFSIEGRKFLQKSLTFQTEVFGPLTLAVLVKDIKEMFEVACALNGNLTGSVYLSDSKEDELIYSQLEPILRLKVGRLLNNKMPTGVAVTAAMHHGGPFPATSHPGFTSVGLPAAFLRFAARHCYDNVPNHRLPIELQNKNPNGRMWRLIDGEWSRGDIKI